MLRKAEKLDQVTLKSAVWGALVSVSDAGTTIRAALLTWGAPEPFSPCVQLGGAEQLSVARPPSADCKGTSGKAASGWPLPLSVF